MFALAAVSEAFYVRVLGTIRKVVLPSSPGALSVDWSVLVAGFGYIDEEGPACLFDLLAC